MTPPLWQKRLDESERGEWKSWLKAQHSENEDHGIQSHHLMANWWGISGNCDRLYFLGLQNHCRWCSHEIKRCLLLERKAMINLDSILSNRDITLPSNHLILCHPLLLLPSIFPSISVFSNESVLRIRWPKYWTFSFSISPSNEYSGLISFNMDWWISVMSKGLSRVFSNNAVQNHQFFGAQLSL